ncbi:response regulator transcription factor [Microbacterium radiodurans]|uniref:Response regulator transcription factor n=1 Tax=Microbacterium radiodurans TaxID=661398 RepID=A0A5J5IMR2_9MICO|nr:response regulator transcription factor [Microbacterium radiodurans]KAA9084140.1 response regulator transcription factor [Microbacterium radiodurans]
MVTVAVIDDEALVRSGFQMILETAPDIEVVVSADSHTAVDDIARARPEVVLLDLRMPGRSGLQILGELRAWPEPPVVAILTTFDADDHVAAALRAGAAGFLVKDTDPRTLPALIRSLAAGGIVLSPQVSRTIVDRYLDVDDDDAQSKLALLSERERSVLAHLATGASNSEIGGALHLSTGTVKEHVSTLLAKLQVATRLQAALIAQRARLRL